MIGTKPSMDITAWALDALTRPIPLPACLIEPLGFNLTVSWNRRAAGTTHGATSPGPTPPQPSLNHDFSRLPLCSNRFF
jgi:hypothetical protein